MCTFWEDTEPPDSKLIAWSLDAETELEQYDSRIRIIPSRIHAAIFGLENGEVLFADLGSSSGSMLAGEGTKPGAIHYAVCHTERGSSQGNN